jgi:CRISPR/Cas system Type II protein with McrA/HNH and RuvC-like nuclease domain
MDSQKAREQKKITAQRLRQLLEKQQYRCFFTGRRLDPETASVDHMLPVSRGGCHTIDNVCIAHMDVNRAKGTLTVDEFIEMCREVVEWSERYKFDD